MIDHIKGSSERVQPGDVHVENSGQGHKMGKWPAGHSTVADNPGFVDSMDDDPETIQLQSYWEQEQSTSQIQDVQGRLKNKLSFWREILQAPVSNIDCIVQGYKLPLLSHLPQHMQVRTRVLPTKMHILFHQQSLNCYRTVVCKGFHICHTFTVPCQLYPIM